jgi:predicted O-methyltransferase YrrM
MSNDFKNWVDDVPPNSKGKFIQLLRLFLNKKARILEIGSFDGRSISEMLTILPDSTALCVDTWAHEEIDKVMITLNYNILNAKEDFNRNVAKFGSRISVMEGKSQLLLSTLPKESFDIIYVDGSHKCLDVLIDAIWAWELVKPNGIIIFDDYLWLVNQPGYNILDIPYMAIKHFLEIYKGKYTILHFDYRITIRKNETS